MKLLVRTIDFCVARSTEIFVSVQRQMALVRSFIKPERQLHLQINPIKAAATSVVTTMCIQKRTELDQYTIRSKTATKQTQKTCFTG